VSLTCQPPPNSPPPLPASFSASASAPHPLRFVLGSISTHPPKFKDAVASAGASRDTTTVEDINPTANGGGWPSQAEELLNFESQAKALAAGGVDVSTPLGSTPL
jgi:hypothetical protein